MNIKSGTILSLKKKVKDTSDQFLKLSLNHSSWWTVFSCSTGPESKKYETVISNTSSLQYIFLKWTPSVPKESCQSFYEFLLWGDVHVHVGPSEVLWENLMNIINLCIIFAQTCIAVLCKSWVYLPLFLAPCSLFFFEYDYVMWADNM